MTESPVLAWPARQIDRVRLDLQSTPARLRLGAGLQPPPPASGVIRHPYEEPTAKCALQRIGVDARVASQALP